MLGVLSRFRRQLTVKSAKMALKWRQVGPKLAPRRGQEGEVGAKMAASWGQEGAKRAKRRQKSEMSACKCICRSVFSDLFFHRKLTKTLWKIGVL